MSNDIQQGNLTLGIELGSTRIKAVLLDSKRQILATGNFDWENRLSDGIWTYDLSDVIRGLQGAYSCLSKQVISDYGLPIKKIRQIGISAMMHGYLAFDKDDRLLVPFRTWRNSMTQDAVNILNPLLNFNIPQRYSIAHLAQAVINREPHLADIASFTTLSGYVHYLLSGERVLGIGDASGMFPIDSVTKNYREDFLHLTQQKLEELHFNKSLKSLLPKVLCAGESAGSLTAQGAKLLDISGALEPGSLMCPPEGDAGTGMIATNSITKKCGNISAGTSVFAMIVLEKNLSKMYEEVDIVATPAGDTVAMIHANNCSTEINEWVRLFHEFSVLSNSFVSLEDCYSLLFKQALEGAFDCDRIITYGFHSGEDIVHLPNGRPLLMRHPNSEFRIANLMRSIIFSSFSAVAIGMETLYREGVEVDSLLAHGGIFKTPVVAQTLLAAALNTPITVMNTAGEGGAYGIAILADYLNYRQYSTEQYLREIVFPKVEVSTISPNPEHVDGFKKYLQSFQTCLEVEKAASVRL